MGRRGEGEGERGKGKGKEKETSASEGSLTGPRSRACTALFYGDCNRSSLKHNEKTGCDKWDQLRKTVHMIIKYERQHIHIIYNGLPGYILIMYLGYKHFNNYEQALLQITPVQWVLFLHFHAVEGGSTIILPIELFPLESRAM